MPFSLPELPYPHDALAPYMSRETLEYHHDKHHKAYVDTANKLIKGSEWDGKSLEEVVKGAHGKNDALFNNAAQHYNVSGVVRPQPCLSPARRQTVEARRSDPWDDARRSGRARRAGKLADRPRSSCRFR